MQWLGHSCTAVDSIPTRSEGRGKARHKKVPQAEQGKSAYQLKNNDDNNNNERARKKVPEASQQAVGGALGSETHCPSRVEAHTDPAL